MPEGVRFSRSSSRDSSAEIRRCSSSSAVEICSNDVSSRAMLGSPSPCGSSASAIATNGSAAGEPAVGWIAENTAARPTIACAVNPRSRSKRIAPTEVLAAAKKAVGRLSPAVPEIPAVFIRSFPVLYWEDSTNADPGRDGSASSSDHEGTGEFAGPAPTPIQERLNARGRFRCSGQASGKRRRRPGNLGERRRGRGSRCAGVASRL